MKRKSIFAIITAAVLLTGCSSQEAPVAPDSSAPAESTPAASGSEPLTSSAPVTPAEPDTSSSSSVSSKPENSTGTSSAAAVPETPEITKPADTTKPVTEPPAVTTAPPATAATMRHDDPSGDDYVGTDISGSTGDKKHSDGYDGFDIEIMEEADGLAMDVAAAAPGDYGGDWGFGAIDPGSIEYAPQPEAGLLTGGEWNDNDNWEFWQGLYDSQNYSEDWSGYKEAWRTGADFRLEVTVKDSAGNLVSGARVSSDEPKYSAVTDNEGKAYLFYSFGQVINGFTELTVTFGDYSQSEKLTLGSDESLEITLEREVKPAEKTLDFMIMCDTTGSMGDELDYLKEELRDVVTRIKQENANIPTRLSVNFYRDEGDEYVVRSFPFTTDLDAAVNAIGQQYANGGGDTPEAVHTALNNAINDHDWDENAVKVMFLVLDAPPHEDVQIIDETVKLVRTAAEKGIRIIPVAASGVDKSCEYLLRSMAFMTGGTYTFLTDDSGIGFGHTEPTIGSYDVEKLNDMMVRITGEYLR